MGGFLTLSNQQVHGLAKLCHDATDWCLFQQPFVSFGFTHDNYARYFLGAKPPFTTPFTTVSNTVAKDRTDQAVMTRQELIRLQRTRSGFPQSLLQYLGTFSREHNQPAPYWPNLNGHYPAQGGT